MTEFHALEPCPNIPDDLTVAQFILDSHHPARPLRPYGTPWLIEDGSGREIGYEEVCYTYLVLRRITGSLLGADADVRFGKCFPYSLGNPCVVIRL